MMFFAGFCLGLAVGIEFIFILAYICAKKKKK